ncbi:putative TetR family transcriptional regulator [Gordonia araii NBRC 100433]|uniref:Putative TetR family transcriptional regulator n=1 Tax=Gordonia araii NBRC 100433 TaxID=1073574 RepID=G7H7N3_9ACTN|nr:TetR/AcrR family transcriptional regulator [Gordonia araii]NNG97856.1 TetR/AcrR family transcriptional regulator [Gordonia araii NBRC 100433]GAB11858.1 putative TetR family transcriptional regulator [Gordonia araii NBRC 100433]
MQTATILPFPQLIERLPALPPPRLDPLLDATVVCLARHGLSKTSVSDIAREMGVAPSTVYRNVGSVDNAVLLVIARDGHRLIQRIPEVIADVEGPRVITVFLAEAIRRCRDHPVVGKILRDEAEWVGKLATRRLDSLLQESADVAAPLLAAAMAAGVVREQDPMTLAHWIVRIWSTCIFSPPPGDLTEALDFLLLPVLQP